MFQGATSFNGDISNWDVSSVGNMKEMFRDARTFKRNLCGASWVRSNAIKTGMFVGSSGSISREVCASNRPTSRDICTRTLPASAVVFQTEFKITSDKDLRREVSDYLKKFPNGECNGYCAQGPMGEWDVSSVADMSNVFADATEFNGDISNWDVSRVTDMSKLFSNAKNFNGDISKWDVSRVTNMNSMFRNAESFNGDISSWDVSRVRDMTNMFTGALSFQGDLKNWDVQQREQKERPR